MMKVICIKESNNMNETNRVYINKYYNIIDDGYNGLCNVFDLDANYNGLNYNGLYDKKNFITEVEYRNRLIKEILK